MQSEHATLPPRVGGSTSPIDRTIATCPVYPAGSMDSPRRAAISAHPGRLRKSGNVGQLLTRPARPSRQQARTLYASPPFLVPLCPFWGTATIQSRLSGPSTRRFAPVWDTVLGGKTLAYHRGRCGLRNATMPTCLACLVSQHISGNGSMSGHRWCEWCQIRAGSSARRAAGESARWCLRFSASPNSFRVEVSSSG
jgi:hypothetical protein